MSRVVDGKKGRKAISNTCRNNGVIGTIEEYFHSGRQYKQIIKRLEEVHGVKRRSVLIIIIIIIIHICVQ